MAQLTHLVQYLDGLLETATYRDSSLNGLQVETSSREISRAAFAVDAAESTIRKAATFGAKLLVVHHGLYWTGGKESTGPLTGVLARRVELLMQNGISLYVSHLPLDGNMTLGNNVELARYFGAERLEPFCEFSGSFIGCKGVLPSPRPLEELVSRGKELVKGTRSEASGLPLLLAFGPKVVSSIGFVSGSGSLALGHAKDAGLDLLISGESKHEAYHSAQELGLNALFCGHYRTETFGVAALQRRLEKEFNLSTLFIDEDSGI
jgi:dinuclear metal center YbgI/SA1388 family protein